MRKYATILCFLLLLISVALVPLSFFLPAYDYQLSLGKAFHAGLLVYRVYDLDEYFRWRTFCVPDPSIVFYSDAEYGPYEGSVFGLGTNDQLIGFGETWGIYFRHFSGSSGWSFWTLRLSLWYPLLVFSLLSFAFAFPQIFRNYSLKGLLFGVAVVAAGFGATKVSGIEHPVTVVCTLGLCVLLRLIGRRVFRQWRPNSNTRNELGMM